MDGQRFLRGQVWWIGTSKDYVGTLQSPNRPYVIVSNNVGNRNAGIVMVVPCTTEIKRLDMPTHIECEINGKKNMIMCEQIKTVSTDELLNYMFTLDDIALSKIDEALKMALGIVDKKSNEIVVKEDEQQENAEIPELASDNTVILSIIDDKYKRWDNDTKREYIIYYEQYGKDACAKKYNTSTNTKANYLRFCKSLNITPMEEKSGTI